MVSKKIIILGATGLIGSNFVRFFKNQGHEVLALSRLEFSDSVKGLDTFIAYDLIINCIGSSNVGFSYLNSSNDFESNVGVLRKVLELLREHKLNHIKFINLSSAAVYGNPKRFHVMETDSTQPLSPYGFHKSMAELLLQEYSQCFGLETLSSDIRVPKPPASNTSFIIDLSPNIGVLVKHRSPTKRMANGLTSFRSELTELATPGY